MDKQKLSNAADALSDLTMSEWTTLKFIIDSCFDEKQKAYMRTLRLPQEDVKRRIKNEIL